MRPERLLEFLRSALSGAIATGADLAVLAILVNTHIATARTANVPALVVGAVLCFVLNRNFAFRAQHGNVAKQAALFLVVELIALAINGLAYELVLRGIPSARPYFLLVRLITSNATYVLWSFPLWKLVFRVRAR